MLIVGAKGHAKEILDLLHQNNMLDEVCFFDDISEDIDNMFMGKFNILRTLHNIESYFNNYPDFILGIGEPKLRKMLGEKLENKGGKMISIVAKSALVSNYGVEFGAGLNIMHNAMISSNVKIGRGTLINAYASIHHDVLIGEFCEVSPHVALLGNCKIGNLTSIGSNSTVLPNIKVGNNVIIGAGAVVNKDVTDNTKVVGVPARVIL